MKSKSFRSISNLLLSASILASGFCLSSPVHAYDIEASAVDSGLLPTGTEIDGKRYWDVSEMAEASRLINAKRQEYCAGDSMCEENLSWQQGEEFGGVYRALDPFENTRFVMTSISPSTEKLKFLYHDEDKMLGRMMGQTVRHDIASVYTVWVEESLGSPTTNDNWLSYGQRAPYHLGSAEEVEAATHLIFDESEIELGSGWFTPNIEREYYVPGSNLASNTKAQIFFSLNATTGGGHIHGTIDYSSCVNSSDYTDGMECRIMYNDEGYSRYIPFNPLTARGSIDTPEDTTSTSDATDSDASPETSSTAGRGSVVSLSSTTASSDLKEASSANQSLAKAPETGVSTREGYEENNRADFPWWTVFIFSAIILTLSLGVVWSFFKNSNEKNG